MADLIAMFKAAGAKVEGPSITIPDSGLKPVKVAFEVRLGDIHMEDGFDYHNPKPGRPKPYAMFIELTFPTGDKIKVRVDDLELLDN